MAGGGIPVILGLTPRCGPWPSSERCRPCYGAVCFMCRTLNKGKIDMNAKKYAAELIGTFWLTFAGCGSAVIAAGFPQVGIGLLGVALAFGLTVLNMAYAIGHISG